MTVEEFLALPTNDGVDRELIEGELRERPLTFRNATHSRVTAMLSYLLIRWNLGQPEPQGEVLNGEAGFRLSDSPDTFVGIDVACVNHEGFRHRRPNSTILEGTPILAAEILLPSETQQDVNDKFDLYLRHGVAVVWLIDPMAPSSASIDPMPG